LKNNCPHSKAAPTWQVNAAFGFLPSNMIQSTTPLKAHNSGTPIPINQAVIQAVTIGEKYALPLDENLH